MPRRAGAARARLGAAAAVAAALLAAGPGRAAEEGCLVFPPVQASAAAAPVDETIGGRPVLRRLPPHPKGVIYLFHGTGGSERFATRVQTARTLAVLEAAGYGWAAAPSADRTNPIRWKVDDASTANPDVAYMLALHRALIAKGEIAAATPVFTMGMSNGGAFANLFATVAKREGLPVAAVADYMGPFPPAMRALVADAKALPPTFVVLSRNDGYVAPDRVAAYAAQLAAGGARVETHLDLERPVCADTFAVLPGLSPEARRALVSETLPAAGVIDAAGRRTVFRGAPTITPDDMASLRAKLQALPIGGPGGREVANTLFIAWAAHEMRADWADRQLAFFDAALGRGR